MSAAVVSALPRIDGLPLMKPPYGRITAYDMNKGEIAWQIANGDTPPAIKNNPALQGVNIPRTGSPSHAGLLVTKTLLFAGEGWGGQPMFRAYDKATGQIIWETTIAAGTQSGLPMTYMYQGRQYIVFTAGTAATTPAQLVAFAIHRRRNPPGLRKIQRDSNERFTCITMAGPSPSSPAWCSAKSNDHGSRLRARRGAPLGATRLWLSVMLVPDSTANP